MIDMTFDSFKERLHAQSVMLLNFEQNILNDIFVLN